MHGVGGLVGNWAAGAAMAIIGLLILRLNPKSVPNRIFGALLVTRGFSLLDGFLAVHALGVAQGLLAFDIVLEMTLAPLAVLVGLWWPRPRSGARSPLVWAALGLAAVVPIVVALVRSGWFVVVARAEHGGFEVTLAGYGVAVSELQQVAYAGLGLLFAIERLRSGGGAKAGGFLLVSTGFSLAALFSFANAATSLVGLQSRSFQGPGATLVDVMYTVAGLLAIGSFAVLATDLVRRRRESGAPNAFALGLLLASFTMGLLNLGDAQVISSRVAFGVIAIGLARMGLPVLVGFALARRQLEGLDIRAKWTIEKGTLVAIFIAVFFLVSEAAQEFFGQRTGSTYIGIAGAALLVFALHPLQRLVERMASAALPGVEDTREWRRAQAEQSFRLALDVALADGKISRREEEALARLADTLELSAQVVLQLRREAETRDGG